MAAEKTFVLCVCEGEAVCIELDEWWPSISLSYWPRGWSYPLSWWERLRWAWQIIRCGRPYTDMVLLDSERAAGVGALLTQLASELKIAEDKQKETPPSSKG